MHAHIHTYLHTYIPAAQAFSSSNIVPDLRVAGLGLVDAMRQIYSDAACNASLRSADEITQVPGRSTRVTGSIRRRVAHAAN